MDSLEPINILLVDDRTENLLALEAVLSEENYRLVKATSGEMALRHLMKEEFAVIVLDVQMPGMDGIETAKWIKAREKTKNIPIIFISANYKETEHLFAGYSAGGIDYMVKPFIPHILRSKIHSFVGMFMAQKRLEAQKMMLHQKTEELERMNHQLEVAKDEAERAAQVRSQFLAMISHEIRTPMNGVLGMVDLLMDSELSEEQRNYCEMIYKSASTLIQTLNSILDFSKMESGKIELEEYPFDPYELVQDVVQLLAPETGKSLLHVKIEFDERVPACVIGDVTKLRQVFMNLIGNAVKFTKEGYIYVRARMLNEGKNGEHCVIEFEVEDTGIGIAEEKMALLFQPFSQLDSSMNRRYGGTGLGLAISKSIIKTMGGEINAFSLESGALFRFHVTLKTVSHSEFKK